MSVQMRAIRVMRCDAYDGDRRCNQDFSTSGDYSYSDFAADAVMCGWSVSEGNDLCPIHSGGKR